MHGTCPQEGATHFLGDIYLPNLACHQVVWGLASLAQLIQTCFNCFKMHIYNGSYLTRNTVIKSFWFKMKQVRCSPKSAILPSAIGNFDVSLPIRNSDCHYFFFLLGVVVSLEKQTNKKNNNWLICSDKQLSICNSYTPSGRFILIYSPRMRKYTYAYSVVVTMVVFSILLLLLAKYEL